MVDKAWWIKNLETQWKTEKKNLRINLIKNLLTQWKTEKKNQKIGGNLLFIDREVAKLEDDAEASLPKLTKLVKKPFNLIRTEKEKPHYPISHFLAYFIEHIGRSCSSFIDG